MLLTDFLIHVCQIMKGGMDVDDKLANFLLKLSSRDGTPEQARRSVSAMASLLRGPGAFEPLLQALTSPSRLSIDANLVSILAALSELAECAPEAMASARGEKAVAFAIEQILLGRLDSGGTDDDEDSTTFENAKSKNVGRVETPVCGRRRKSMQQNKSLQQKHTSPNSEQTFFEDEALSVSCRTICAAIEFLASYFRSTILASRMISKGSDWSKRKRLYPEAKLIDSFFEALCQILQNHGMPPSAHRRDCHLRQERAAIRTTSALALLRLCDARLGLDNKFLSTGRWHALSGVFLDDEKVCRETVMSELGLMLTQNGKFGSSTNAGPAVAPNLRFFAFLVLCVDSDQGAVHCEANGNAANVGKLSQITKSNATEGIRSRRRAFDETSARARASGPEAEEEFEKMKTALMPEHVVPYALHLLALRKETPSLGSSTQGHFDSSKEISVEDSGSQLKVLRRRLKWLFDPLVLSLGDSAGNISFLLRMVEVFGKSIQPILHTESEELRSSKHDIEVVLATSKLQLVCSTAREALLSYVKKDVNLAVYPGTVQAPLQLFRRKPVPNIGSSIPARANSSRRRYRKQSMPSSPREDGSRATQSSRSRESFPESTQHRLEESSKSRASSTKLQSKLSPSTSSTHGRVHFSPELAVKKFETSPGSEPPLFDDLSPIRAKQSLDGDQGLLLSSGEKTRGTTPPSVVRNTRFSSSVGLEGGPTVSESPLSKSSGAESTSKSSRNVSAVAEEKTPTTPTSTRDRRPTLKKKALSDINKATPKRRKVPKQIVVRKKPEGTPRPQRKTRNLKSSVRAAEECLDFASSTDIQERKATQRGGKENQQATKKQKSRIGSGSKRATRRG